MRRRTFVYGSALGIPAAPLVVDAQHSGTMSTVGVLVASSAPRAGFGIAWTDRMMGRRALGLAHYLSDEVNPKVRQFDFCDGGPRNRPVGKQPPDL